VGPGKVAQLGYDDRMCFSSSCPKVFDESCRTRRRHPAGAGWIPRYLHGNLLDVPWLVANVSPLVRETTNILQVKVTSERALDMFDLLELIESSFRPIYCLSMATRLISCVILL